MPFSRLRVRFELAPPAESCLEMDMKEVEVDLLTIINELNKVPLVSDDKTKALTRIAQLGRQALRSQVCTLVLVDIRNKSLIHTACAGFDERFEKWMSGRVIKMGSSKRGYFIDAELLSKGESGERYNLQEDGQGIVNPSVAKRYNFNSILSYPLKTEEDGLIGYFNHFASKNVEFDEEEKKLIEIFGHQALITIERFDYLRALDHSLRILNDLSQSLLSDPPDDFFNQVSIKAAELLDVPICIVWKLDKRQNKLRIIGSTHNVDEAYKRIELDLNYPGIEMHLSNRKAGYLRDVRISQPIYYKHPKEAMERGWISLLSAPMWIKSELVGMINVYTTSVRHFKKREKEFFEAFANQAAVSIEEKRKLREREIIIAGIQRAYSSFTNNDRTLRDGQLHEVVSLIAEQSAKALDANVCFLHFLNKANNILELKGLFETSKNGVAGAINNIRMGEGVIGKVAQNGESHICQNTSGHPPCSDFLHALNLSSAICVPIKWGNAVIGTIGVGSDKAGAFGKDQQELLEEIVDSMQGAIGRANLGETILKLARASHEAKTPDDLCHQLAEFTRDLIREPVCVVWLLDKDRNGFTVRAQVGPEGQEVDLAAMFISNETKDLDVFLRRATPLFFPDASKTRSHPYKDLLQKLEWKSMLAMPLIVKKRVLGIVEVYSYKEKRDFKGWPIKLFESWATQASIAIGNAMARERLEILGKLTRRMAETNRIEQLLDVALEGGLELVRSGRGWISRLDPVNGTLDIMNDRGNPIPPLPRLPVEEGITGRALESKQPVMAEDVLEEQWKGIYVPYWQDTRSELAMPILLRKAEARIGTSIELKSKRIGVLNVESPTLNAFSEDDQESLLALARMTAIMIERLELDRKVRELTDVETNIVGVRGFDETIRIVMKAIEETLGYDSVNISLVVPELNCIRTEYITGIEDYRVEEFKKLATHQLDSTDIQAWIVEHKEIEVPGEEDARYDSIIHEKFGHQDFVRVFLPMIVPADQRVIGTVEAGYRKTKYRKYIYEQDIQILQGFLTYAVQALENREKRLIETICHELRAPIVGTRNNASFLLENIKYGLPGDKIDRKLQDINTDCEILLNQVDELEYILGGVPPVPKPEFTIVMRDVVIKTINQCKPIIREMGFDITNIEYKNEDVGKIRIIIDRRKLNQVVTNLIINSIKYAEEEIRDFKIRISVDQTATHHILKFKDWGIGIKKGLENKVFEKGYRTPEAIEKNVTGSGLGLTLALEIMKELGGDLVLANNRKPTEFHIVLPKKPKEEHT